MPGLQQAKLTPDWFTFGLPTPVLLSPDRQLPGVGTQFEFDQFKDGLPNMTGPGLRNRLPGRSDGSDSNRTNEAVLMDTVACLQLKMKPIKSGPPGHQTLGRPPSPVPYKPVMFMSTKVPRFAGVTSWEQHRQVFDAIAQSNGWVTPQLLCNCCLAWRVMR